MSERERECVCVCVCERERERERERETERQRDRETERQRDRERERLPLGFRKKHTGNRTQFNELCGIFYNVWHRLALFFAVIRITE